MNTSMQKTYLIKARNFKEIANGKGALEYLLLDENGIERKVTATAEQGHFRAFKNIKAIYKRELPLIKALAEASVNDSVYVDFSKFNARNPRQKIDKNSIKPQYIGTTDFYDTQELLIDKTRLVKLFFICSAGFVGILLIAPKVFS